MAHFLGRAVSFTVLATTLMAASAARASVTEPDGTVVPTDNSVGREVQVQTLFMTRGEALDEKTDALIVPAVFSPTCGFTGTLVLSQAGCHSALGWYNVDPARTTAPTPAEVFSLVPQNAALNTQFSGGDIQADARYTGGLIGFAIWDTSGCTQYHYLEPKWNPLHSSGNPWVEALVYQSVVTPNAYYIAFEDGNSSTNSFANDGDFNDKVFFVTGITCQGGGTACDTGLKGVCAAGVQQCHGGALTCTQTTPSSAEK
ncbi:MAG: Tryptophan synthase alpha chain, partial [Myxococcales bacterium]|nr:Tryptophan synthase alpha chain [Myxococcales bacterium]